MSFTPRTLDDGRICCSNEQNLCAKCKAHFATETRMSNEPPDPYDAPIKARRAASGYDARELAAHADDDKKVTAMSEFRGQVLRTAATSQAAAMVPCPKPIEVDTISCSAFRSSTMAPTGWLTPAMRSRRCASER